MRFRGKVVLIGIVLLLLGFAIWQALRITNDEDALHIETNESFSGSFGFLPGDHRLVAGTGMSFYLDSLRVLQDKGYRFRIVGYNHNLEEGAPEGVNRGVLRAEQIRDFMEAFLETSEIEITHEACSDSIPLLTGQPAALFRIELIEKAGAE
jgi:hypothetical protein